MQTLTRDVDAATATATGNGDAYVLQSAMHVRLKVLWLKKKHLNYFMLTCI